MAALDYSSYQWDLVIPASAQLQAGVGRRHHPSRRLELRGRWSEPQLSGQRSAVPREAVTSQSPIKSRVQPDLLIILHPLENQT